MKYQELENTWRPIKLNIRKKSDEKLFRKLKRKDVIIEDKIVSQLVDLMHIRHPKGKTRVSHLIKFHTNKRNLSQYGNWFYYPWLNRIIHCLPESEFIEVRTNRNRYRISDAEQMLLKTKKIGIIGMSFGSAIAIALATERNFGEIRLADYDQIELVNLNRMSFGINNLLLRYQRLCSAVCLYFLKPLK